MAYPFPAIARVDSILMAFTSWSLLVQTGLDQYAIKKFAEALEVVPRILSETSGQDAEKVRSRLRVSFDGFLSPTCRLFFPLILGSVGFIVRLPPSILPYQQLGSRSRQHADEASRTLYLFLYRRYIPCNGWSTATT